MVKTQNVDIALLNEYIQNSGLKLSFLADQLGISTQAFSKKRNGITAFRKSEVFVMCNLLNIPDDGTRQKIFFPNLSSYN